MKKILRLTTTLIVLLFLGGNAWGQTYSHTITAKTWSVYDTQTLSGVAWTAAATGGAYLGYDGTKGQQFGSKGSPATLLTLSTSDFPGTITTVKISTSGAASINGTASVSVGGNVFSPTSITLTSSNALYSFTGSASGEVLITWNQTSSKALYLKSIEVTYAGGSTPTITLSKTSLSGFTYTFGSGPSAEQSFTAEGSNLTANISIAATTNYEISTGTGVTFVATNPITLSQSSGTVSSTTIYVRLKAGLGVGSYNNEDITATSTGATDKTVTCSGSVTAPITSGDIVISQVYGGGGNSEDTYKNDFIELFNRSAATVNIDGWSVQYASATGESWTNNKTDLPNVSLAPGQYFLIAQNGGSVGADLPTPDLTGNINMSGTVGKVALVSSTTALTGSCPTDPNIIDFVGFGTTANCYEGTGPTPAPSNTTSVIRANAGCTDDNDNSTDFTAESPVPRNTSTTLNPCGSTPTPEPTNHVTNFGASTASPTYSALDVVWDDAVGATIPDGYVIKASDVSYAAIDAPVDGTPETPGTLIKVVASGVEVANFTGLDENTTYFFKIWPFTNSGAAIDYKTDGTVPQDEATTTYGIPAAPVATAATDVSAIGFTANWNAVAGATGYSLDVYTKTIGGDDVTETESFDGITPNGNLIGPDPVYLSGWSVLSQSTSRQIYTTATNYGLSSPSFAFTITGDFIETATYASPVTSLSFWGKQQSGATSSTLIEGYNGSSWSTIATLSNKDVATAGTVTYDLVALGKTDVIKIRLVYTKVAGNLAVDDVAVTYGGSSNTPIAGSPFTITGDNSKAITGLTPATDYYYVVRATNASGTSGNSNEISVATLASPVTSTYTGTGTWTNASNWSNGLPTGTTDVIINGNVTVDDVVECNDMTVSPTGAVTVGAGSSNGLIVNGNFLIESNATGTGSFIGAAADYAIGETTTIQRYLTGGWDGWDAGWHQLSSPVAAQPIADFATTGSGNDYDFYGWDEPTDTWMNYKAAGFSTWNSGTNFNEAQGYLVSYEAANTTQTFTGELNTDDVIFVNLSNGGASFNGWHLLGNPYASALIWNDANWILEDVAGTAKIWHEANKSYSDIAANGIIPSAQGFMVQVSSGTNGVGIPGVSRTHSATPFYKSGTEQLLLVAAETEGGSAQESKIIVNPMATEGFDFDYDSRFLAGYAPMLYSIVGDESLSTNSLPELATGKVIPLGFVKNAATAFTIELKESIPAHAVYLTDKKTDIVTNLTETPVYSFTSSEGDDPNRFELKFGAVGIDDNVALEQISIYSHGQSVYISSVKSTQAVISIYNITGQQVYANTMVIDGQKQIALNTPTGWYIVKVTTAAGVATQKVFIKSN